MPARLTVLARDLTGIAGISAVTYGAHLVYSPAGYIIGGLFAVGATALLTLVDQKAGD